MIVTLTASEYADLLRLYDCIQVPVAVQGFVYAVTRSPLKKDIYRVAVA